LQCIILDSSPKKYLGAKYIVWARNIFIGRVYLLGAFIYSGRVYLFCLDFPSTPINITHRSPPLDPCRSTSTNLEGSARLNRRVSGSTLLQQHHPNLTCPKNNLVVLTSRPSPRAIFPSALATVRVIDDLGVIPYPEGVMTPKLELNVNAKDSKFRYVV
jgi:hypothetical protein